MGKRKFEQELDSQLGGGSFSHLVPEEQLAKKQNRPAPPKIGARPIMDIKLGWEVSSEALMKVMLDCGANVPVVSQEVVESARSSKKTSTRPPHTRRRREPRRRACVYTGVRVSF